MQVKSISIEKICLLTISLLIFLLLSIVKNRVTILCESLEMSSITNAFHILTYLMIYRRHIEFDGKIV